MSMEELHGIFQFADDLFGADQTPEEALESSRRKVDLNFSPRTIYPGWFNDVKTETTDMNFSDEEIQQLRHQIPLLYLQGDYEETHQLASKLLASPRLNENHRTSGIIREAAESAACALLKLNRANEALAFLPLMTGVEEPGRHIIRARVFFAVKMFEECSHECRLFLSLRPGDYSIMILLAKCLLQSIEQADEHAEATGLLIHSQDTISSYLENPAVSNPIKLKLIQDKQEIESLLKQ